MSVERQLTWTEATLPLTADDRQRARDERVDWRSRVPGASRSCSPPQAVIDEGLCQASGLDFFGVTAAERHAARRVCWECPVRRECLQWALNTLQIWGSWGGCDEHELRRTLSVNARGAYAKRSRAVRCPLCTSHSVLSETLRVACLACGLSWPRVPRPRQRRRLTFVIAPEVEALVACVCGGSGTCGECAS